MTKFSRIAILSAAVVAVFTLWTGNKDETLTALPENIELPESIEEVPTVAESLVMIDPKELDCLRRNIYFEAGDQDMNGKEAIAEVVFKRMEVSNTRTFPKDVCSVVYQRKQFSWTWLTNHIPGLHNKLEVKAWEDSRIAAEKALRGELNNLVGDSTHYYSKKAMKRPPYWVTANKRMVYITTIGDHVFYRDSKLKFGTQS